MIKWKELKSSNLYIYVGQSTIFYYCKIYQNYVSLLTHATSGSIIQGKPKCIIIVNFIALCYWFICKTDCEFVEWKYDAELMKLINISSLLNLDWALFVSLVQKYTFFKNSTTTIKFITHFLRQHIHVDFVLRRFRPQFNLS